VVQQCEGTGYPTHWGETGEGRPLNTKVRGFLILKYLDQMGIMINLLLPYRSPGDTKPPPAQFGKMKEPLWNASNSVKGLFRWRSPPGSRYGNGKRKFGGRLVVPRDTLDDQVTITPRAGHLRLEDLRRELGRRELEEGGMY